MRAVHMPTAVLVLDRLSKGLPAFESVVAPPKGVVAFRRGVLDWLAVSGYTTRVMRHKVWVPQVTPAGLEFMQQPRAVEWLKALTETPDAPSQFAHILPADRDKRIAIEMEPPEMFEAPPEHCIFCDRPTRYWNKQTNTPVCGVDAAKNRMSDLLKRLAQEEQQTSAPVAVAAE